MAKEKEPGLSSNTPSTPETSAEITKKIKELATERDGIFSQMDEVRQDIRNAGNSKKKKLALEKELEELRARSENVMAEEAELAKKKDAAIVLEKEESTAVPVPDPVVKNDTEKKKKPEPEIPENLSKLKPGIKRFIDDYFTEFKLEKNYSEESLKKILDFLEGEVSRKKNVKPARDAKHIEMFKGLVADLENFLGKKEVINETLTPAPENTAIVKIESKQEAIEKWKMPGQGNLQTISPTPIPKTEEAPKVDAEKLLGDARSKYAEGYKKFLAERRKSAGKLATSKRYIFGEKVPDAEVPPELKALEAEYDAAAVACGNVMFKAKWVELLKDGSLTEDQRTAELDRFKQNEIFTRIVVDEQTELNKLKIDNLPPKEKGVMRRGMEKGLGWYMNQSRPKKIAISFALSTGFAFFVLPSSIVAAGGGLSYIGIKAARTFVGLGAGQGTAKLYDLIFKDKSTEEKNAAKEKLAQLFDSTSLSDTKKEYASILEKEQKAKRSRLVKKAVASMVAGGVASMGTGYKLGHMLHDAHGQLPNDTTPKTTLHKVTPKLNDTPPKVETGTKVLESAKVTPVAAPAVEEVIKPNDIAVVHKGEGIENALRRQIEANPDLAKSLPGYKEGMDLHKFSGGAAHRIALEKGYVDKVTGEEIRVRPADQIAYKLKLHDGKMEVHEVKLFKGQENLMEIHDKETPFEGNNREDYEYGASPKHESVVENTSTSTPQAKEIENSLSHGDDDAAERLRKQIFGQINEKEQFHLARTGNEESALFDSNHKADSIFENQGNILGGHWQHYEGLSPGEDDLLNQNWEFVGKNQFHLLGKKLLETWKVYELNAIHLFNDDWSNWRNLQNMKATDWVADQNTGEAPSEPFLNYMHKLSETSGLRPRGASWLGLGKAETVKEYMARALQKAARDGNLDKLKL